MSYEVDHKNKTVVHDGEKHIMPKKEFDMLCYIKDNKDRIISREELLERLWPDVIVDRRTVDVHLLRIRKRFPDVPIITRRCFGYIWKTESWKQ